MYLYLKSVDLALPQTRGLGHNMISQAVARVRTPSIASTDNCYRLVALMASLTTSNLITGVVNNHLSCTKKAKSQSERAIKLHRVNCQGSMQVGHIITVRNI